MTGNVIIFNPPKPPDEWEEAFSVRVCRNGQIFMLDADGMVPPQELAFVLQDVCKRVLEYRIPPKEGQG